MKLTLRLCRQAQQEHRQSCRQFAHVFHVENRICVTPEFYELPQTYRMGILLHELGHIALQSHDHSEAQADEIVFIMSGVRLHRRTYRGMKRLECIERAQTTRARRFITENIGGGFLLASEY